MTAKPEAEARKEIDRQLAQAGWLVQDRATANPHAAVGVAIREFPLKGGPVDYGLYVNGAVAGAVEAKKEGWTLSGVELQSQRYSQGLPDNLPAYRRPLPFLYESTGKETQFTNLLAISQIARRSPGEARSGHRGRGVVSSTPGRLPPATPGAGARPPSKARPRGRPSKFTQERAEQIAWLVRHGFDDSYAAREVGISRTTLYRWLDDPRPQYVAFREAMLDADAHVAGALTANLIRASHRDWRAGLEWLREHHPDRWDWQARRRLSGRRHTRRG